MSAPVVLWLRGQSPAWPGLLRGLGAGALVDVDVDVRSMRAVRSAALARRPDAILYAGLRDPEAAEADTDGAFLDCAEAPIGVAAAALELGAVAVLISHPAVFGGSGGPWRESDEPQPTTGYGEAVRRGEVFLSRAARDRALVVRAGPVLSSGLTIEQKALAERAVRPRPRRVTPIADVTLGAAIRALLVAKERGVVHVSGREVDEVELWSQIARALGVAPPVPAEPEDAPASCWALASERRAEIAEDWSLAFPSREGEASGGARELEIREVFRGSLPRGLTRVTESVSVASLEPGQRLLLDAGPQVLFVRTGKVVTEVGDDADLVLRGGQRLDLTEVGGRVVAVDPSELWLLKT